LIEVDRTGLSPHIRFPEYTGSWVLSRMDDHQVEGYNITYGVLKPEEYVDGGIPMLQIKDIVANQINNQHFHLISESLHYQYRRTKVSENDIIISVVGTIGRIATIPKYLDGCNIHRNLALLKIKDSVSYELIGQALLSNQLQAEIKKNIIGSTQGLYNLKDLRALQFYIPSFPEQQKIADFLSAVDKKIQQLQRKKELLEQYKKGVMQKIFSQEIRFKDENGNDYPDWKEKRLGDVANRIAEKNRLNEFNYVLTNSATQGIVSQRDYFDKDIANQNNLEGYYIVSKNDFVYNPRISTSAPVGPIKRNNLKKGVMSPLYSVFRFEDDLSDYFEYYFETTLWYHYLKSVANFGARHDRMNITNGDFIRMPVMVPGQTERENIILLISGISKKLECANNQLSSTNKFKQGLLQQMFV
jgi:type I restriction enzyme, S subunit